MPPLWSAVSSDTVLRPGVFLTSTPLATIYSVAWAATLERVQVYVASCLALSCAGGLSGGRGG